MRAQADMGSRTAPVAKPSWRDRWLSARDRLLASPRFQHWAAAFPLTRPIAQRRARALFDLCAGFVYAQVLLACVQLRLFEILAEGPQTGPVLAGRLALSPEAAQRLLLAAVSLGLVEHRGQGRFGLGQLGAAFLGNPGVAAMVEHHTLLYGDLHDPVALLRGERAGTELGRYWAYAVGRPAGSAGRRAGRRLQRADVGLAAAGRRRHPGRLPAGAASLPARRGRRRRGVPGRRRGAHARPAPDAVRSAAGGRAGAGTPRRRRARRARHGVRRRLQRRSAAARCGCRLAGAGRPRP